MPRGKLIRWNQDVNKEQLSKMSPSKIKDLDPERYDAIVTMLKEGVGHNSIERAFGLRWHTIQKIAVTEPSLNGGMEVIQGKLKRHVTHALDRMAELLETEPESIKYKDLAIGAAIGVDKLDKLAANQTPTYQTNVQINVAEGQSLSDMLDSLPSAKSKG